LYGICVFVFFMFRLLQLRAVTLYCLNIQLHIFVTARHNKQINQYWLRTSVWLRLSFCRTKLGRMVWVPLVVHYLADLQPVHGFRCYDNTVLNAKCQRVLVLDAFLVLLVKAFCSSEHVSTFKTITTTTTTVLRPFVRDCPCEPVPEETFNHLPYWSSSNLYQLLPPTMIHSILHVSTFKSSPPSLK